MFESELPQLPPLTSASESDMSTAMVLMRLMLYTPQYTQGLLPRLAEWAAKKKMQRADPLALFVDAPRGLRSKRGPPANTCKVVAAAVPAGLGLSGRAAWIMPRAVERHQQLAVCALAAKRAELQALQAGQKELQQQGPWGEGYAGAEHGHGVGGAEGDAPVAMPDSAGHLGSHSSNTGQARSNTCVAAFPHAG
eukprot:101375-Pelagomonas_calceolata.AAC.4